MPAVAESDPFADLIPPSDLIGGEYGAPAYQQDAAGGLSEVPKAQLNTLPVPDTGDMFSDLIPQGPAQSREDLGMFEDLVPQPKTETEKALAETPARLPNLVDLRAGKVRFNDPNDEKNAWVGEALTYAKETIDGISPGFLHQFTTSPFPATHLQPDPKDTRLQALGKAALNQGTGLVEGMTSPLMAATLAAGAIPALSKPVIAGFLADTTSHLPEAFKQAEYARANYPPGSQESIEAGLQLAGLLTFSHLLSRSLTKMPVKPTSASEAPAATMERPVEQTQSGAIGDVRNVPIRQEPVEGNAQTARFQPEPVNTGVQQPIHEGTGLPLNEDGTVTLYHGTTATGAEAIRNSNRLQSSGEPSVYLTTEPSGTGYGDGTVVVVRVKPESLMLDDEFPNGRKDFRIDAKSARVQVESPQAVQVESQVGDGKSSTVGAPTKPAISQVIPQSPLPLIEASREVRLPSDVTRGEISQPETTTQTAANASAEPGTVWYQGVGPDGAPTSYVTSNLEKAKIYAGRRGDGGRINVFTPEQVGETAFADRDGNLMSPQEYAKTQSSDTVIQTLARDGKLPEPTQVLDANGQPIPEPIGTTEAISEIERLNERNIEPVIPKEPAGTKFPAPEVEGVPENLRRSPEIDRLINEPAAQTGSQMKMAPATEGGALGFGGGKRATVTPKGTTPRGDTEFLKIESGPKRIFKGLEREGAADIIGRTKNKVGKLLSEATDKHVDVEQELHGAMSTEMTRPAKGLSSKAVDKAYDEIPAYMAAKENGRLLPAVSPTAQKLVSAWENIADKTGKIMSANGVQVFDPTLNAYRPTALQGRKYVPRMFKQEVEQVLRDRNKDAPLWNDLVTDLAEQRGITEAQAATVLQAEAGRFSSSGFMGAIDMARTSKMPESFYEYDLRNIASRYIPQFSERMAQIIAFGQRLGPREAPVRQNLWDIARKESADVPTMELLNVIEDQSTNVRPKTFGGRFMTGAQTAATGLYLSAPTTTLRNLISGLTATPELLGVRRSVQGLVKIVKNRQAFGDAKEIGVIRDSIGTVLHADKLGDSFVHDVIRSGTDKALKYSGHGPSESFVRTHGFITADIFAKDAVKALNKKPGSMRSKEALGLFKRMGVDAAKIVAEKADYHTGPETRKFIRTFVRETQGGYRYNQTPIWTNSNNGRFLYQFGRWGAMKSRNIVRNGIKPLLGEEVQWHGKTMTRRMNVGPLLKMAVTPVILGETFAGLAQLMFGRDRKDASISEITAAWQEDEKKAMAMAMERVANDVIMAGTLGIWGQPLDWAKSLQGQSRLKNPAEPPGLGSIRALKDLGQKALDQGGQVTRRDVLDFINSFVPGLKQTHDIYRNVMDEPLYEAENDVKTLRAAARRWAEDTGLDVSPRAKGEFRKSPMAPEYEPIKEALLAGDAKRASFLKKTFLDKAENRELAARSLKMSIKMSQPFRAGPYTSKVHRDNFREWARKNLNEDDFKQTQRIQERYQKAAVAADLW